MAQKANKVNAGQYLSYLIQKRVYNNRECQGNIRYILLVALETRVNGDWFIRINICEISCELSGVHSAFQEA